jgi:hypothetical protein
MKRRSLLTARLAVPLTVLDHVDEALAPLPAPASPPTRAGLTAQYRTARGLFPRGAHAALLQALPGLLATAEACAGTGEAADHARLAACYDLATETLSKLGRYDASRITADRSTTYARISGAPWPQRHPPAPSASSCATPDAPPPHNASPSTPPPRSRPPA